MGNSTDLAWLDDAHVYYSKIADDSSVPVEVFALSRIAEAATSVRDMPRLRLEPTRGACGLWVRTRVMWE